MRQESTIPFFTNPAHGFFAVASAQLGKRATASDDNGLLTPPDDTLLNVLLPYDTTEPYTGVPYSYIKGFDNATDRWSAVAAQQPQGYWYAVLAPVKTVIMADDLNGPEGMYATSAEMVFD